MNIVKGMGNNDNCMLMKQMLICLLVLACTHAKAQNSTARQDSIIVKYLNGCAYKNHYLAQSWDDCIKEGLKQDSTIALLWQQRALPLWKTRKYEQALTYYDKAVVYDRERYLGRRGFLKCIFQKNYRDAITDMEAAEREFGYGIQNDHSYQFYIGLCYLQLNEFGVAEQILEKEFVRKVKERGEDMVHHLELFYLGIVQYELRNYDKAILYFDKALRAYSNFSDVQYYKGLCLLQKGDKENGCNLMLVAKSNFEKGYTINEDDVFYETYPYQVNWFMAKWMIPGYKE